MKTKRLVVPLMALIFLVGCTNTTGNVNEIKLDNEKAEVIKERIDKNIVEAVEVKKSLDYFVYNHELVKITDELGDKATNRNLVYINNALEEINNILTENYGYYKETFVSEDSILLGEGVLDEENEIDVEEKPYEFEEGERYLGYAEWLKGYIKSDVYFETKTGNAHIVYSVMGNSSSIVLNISIQGGVIHEVQNL